MQAKQLYTGSHIYFAVRLKMPESSLFIAKVRARGSGIKGLLASGVGRYWPGDYAYL